MSNHDDTTGEGSMRMSRSPGKSAIATTQRPAARTGRAVALSGITRVSALVIAVLIAVFGVLMISGKAMATPGDDDTEKYDFYTLSSNVTAYFSDASEPGKGEGLSEKDGWTQIGTSAAEGGGLLGYGDNDVSGFSGWLVSQTTGSSNTVGYDSLKVRDSNDDGSSSTNLAYSGVLAYGQYGSLLNDLGLDSMSTGLGLHMGSLISGFIMLVLYFLAGGIDGVFAVSFAILDTFNPFKLFFSAIAATSTAMADGMTGGQGVPLPFQSLERWFSGWYQALVNLSWTVLVPLFFTVFIFSSLMWKKGNALGGLKKLAIRLLFLGVGLPLIGSMYTASLSAMKDATGGAGMGATRVVISTYVDFENWAKMNRLAVPEGAVLEWDARKHTPTGSSIGKIRQTTVAINKLANGSFWSVADMNVSELGSISSEATKPDASDSASGGLSISTFAATIDLLTRYSTHQLYQASDFETAIKGRISQQAANGNEFAKNCAVTWFKVQSDGSTKDAKCSDDDVTIDASNNPILNVKDGSGLSASESDNVVTFTTNGGMRARDWVMFGAGADNLASSNLSALAMYNYLNTTFDSNSATTYSSSNAVSAATREYHNSVNLVGSSGVGVLYWLNAAVTLLCFIVLGLAYALGMIIGTIKNSLRVITAVPFATLGSIAGIAKVVIYSFAMIVEIIGTLFIYRVVQEIIVSVPSIFEGGLESMYDYFGVFGTYLKNSGKVTIFTSILSTVMLILLTVMLVRFRGVFVKGLTEAVTKIVDKFLDTSVAPPPGGQFLPALANGVGAGAGMAATNRLMSGRGGSGGSSKGSGVSSGLAVGSGGVQSADGGSGGDSGSVPSINGTDGPDGPEGSGGSALPAGESAGSSSTGGAGVTASIEGGPSGSGDGGSDSGSGGGEGGSSSMSTSASDREVASEVEARGGLSEPAQIEAGPSAGADDPAASSSAANSSDDAMSAAAGSMEQSMDEHRKADQARMGQAASGAKAVWHGGKAAAKAYSGDAAGAAQDGQKAMQDVQQAQAKGQEAKAHRQAATAPSAPAASQPQRTQQTQSPGRAQVQPSRRGSVSGAQPQAAPRAAAPAVPAPSTPRAAQAPQAQPSRGGGAIAPAPARQAPASTPAPRSQPQAAPRAAAPAAPARGGSQAQAPSAPSSGSSAGPAPSAPRTPPPAAPPVSVP